MTITRTRKIALTGLAAVGVLAGSAGLANAVTSRSHAPGGGSAAVAGQPGHDDHDAAPSYTSSVKVPASATENAKSDAAEEAAIADLAKIDLAQAVSSATGAVHGKAIEADLDDEGGNLVYQVDIVTDKGTTEVIVDAGNGHVLAQQLQHDDDGHDSTDKPDAAETNEPTAPTSGAPATTTR